MLIRSQFLTVIQLCEDCEFVEEIWLRQTISDYEAKDDVFRKEFLGGVLFTGSPHVAITSGANDFLHSLGVSWIEIHILEASLVPAPLPGPYYVVNQQISEIWRLYNDVQGAFLTSLIPDADE